MSAEWDDAYVSGNYSDDFMHDAARVLLDTKTTVEALERLALVGSSLVLRLREEANAAGYVLDEDEPIEIRVRARAKRPDDSA